MEDSRLWFCGSVVAGFGNEDASRIRRGSERLFYFERKLPYEKSYVLRLDQYRFKGRKV